MASTSAATAEAPAGVFDTVKGNAFLGLGRAAAVMMTFNTLRAEYDKLVKRENEAGKEGNKAVSEEEWHAFHERGAKECLALARKNGGIYIKAAQFVASLQGGGGDRQVPKQYKEALAALTDAAPAQPFASVEAVLAEELAPRAISDVFECIDKEPTASASLAQVHRAKLRSGGVDVAVKIQYQGLREQMASDFVVFEQMADKMKPGGYDLSWLVKDLKTALNGELDFKCEANHTDEAYRMLCDRKSPTYCKDVTVARVMPGVSSGRVLVTEWMDGLVKCNNPAAVRAAGLDPLVVGDLLASTFMKMVLVSGFVHGDPHAGNVYVRRKRMEPASTETKNEKDENDDDDDDDDTKKGEARAELVVLDHGLYHTLDTESRKNFCKLYLSCVACDYDGIKEHATYFARGRNASSTRDEKASTTSEEEAHENQSGADNDAGALWKYFPLLLSPWFVSGLTSSDTSDAGMSAFERIAASVRRFASLLTDVSCAVGGRLPPHVTVQNLADFLINLHNTNNRMLLIMHSLGYTRGLLNDLKYPEQRRLEIVVSAACDGLDAPKSAETLYFDKLHALHRRLQLMKLVFGPVLYMMLLFGSADVDANGKSPKSKATSSSLSVATLRSRKHFILLAVMVMIAAIFVMFVFFSFSASSYL